MDSVVGWLHSIAPRPLAVARLQANTPAAPTLARLCGLCRLTSLWQAALDLASQELHGASSAEEHGGKGEAATEARVDWVELLARVRSVNRTPVTTDVEVSEASASVELGGLLGVGLAVRLRAMSAGPAPPGGIDFATHRSLHRGSGGGPAAAAEVAVAVAAALPSSASLSRGGEVGGATIVNGSPAQSAGGSGRSSRAGGVDDGEEQRRELERWCELARGVLDTAHSKLLREARLEFRAVAGGETQVRARRDSLEHLMA